MTTAEAAVSDPLAHALAYAALGWRVVPIKAGAKSPALDDWVNQATTDVELIAQWWARWPDHGVGIVCGPESGIFVLDVDPAHGGDETLALLESAYGSLPETVEALTGGGGRHLFFSWPEGQRVTTSAGRLGPGLDVRAAGGQVVAPPSVHPVTGRRYEWEVNHLPGEQPIAPAPAWLLELLGDGPEMPEGQVVEADLAYARDRYDFGDGWRERHVELLGRHGWHSPSRPDRAGRITMVRPGKRDGTGCSIGYHPGVTYVFTDGAPPLTPGGYRLHRLAEVLDHGGDALAADRRLVAEVGGLPTVPDPAATAAWIAEAQTQAIRESEVWEVHDFLARPIPDHDWLVPGLLERGDRLILTGQEGRGKSTLLRQLAVQMASGRAPFGEGDYEPVKVLLVDLENSQRHLRRKIRELVELAGADLERDRLWVVPKPEGLDLATPRDADWLRLVAAAVDPDVIVTGPIYKMSDGDPTEETTAKPVIRILDELRARHDCAIVIEAHVPSEVGTGKRYERPYGASIWRRWPEFGIFLDERGALRHWRGARDEREWPGQLERSGTLRDWPWIVVQRGATYMGMVEVQRAAAKPLSIRAIAEALTIAGKETSKSTVDRALAANRTHWEALLAELFGPKDDEGAEPAPWEA